MNQNKSYIAIDIAKDSLQVQAPDGACSVIYDSSGLRKIASILKKQPAGTIIVCEATGGYERQLIDYLHTKKHPVCLLNPARVRAFARSEGLKAKTDPLDAKLLLRYANERQPPAQPPKDARLKKLAILLDRREQVVEMAAREKARLKSGNATIESMVQQTLRFFKRQIEKLDQSIKELIESDARLRTKNNIIQSVVGVGPVTAWSICAYLPEITEVNRGQLAALAGLAPYNQDSGQKKGLRRIQGGRQKVRNPLYMAAASAATHNPHIKAYVKRLREEKGKPYKCAITAAMRKMLIHIQSLLKNQQSALA